MSLIIKKLKMPKEGCKDCLLVKRGQVYDICPFLKREVNGNVERGGKPYDCPLIELPDHGDLIEKRPIVDALEVAEKNVSFLQRGVEREENIKYCQGAMVGYANSILAIDNAPVIIPAERSEDERLNQQAGSNRTPQKSAIRNRIKQ